MSGLVGDEVNIRIEVDNDGYIPMDVEEDEGDLQGDEVTTTVTTTTTVVEEDGEENNNNNNVRDVEDGEVSSLSDSESPMNDMEVDNGMLADVESSPFRSATERPKFERTLSKLSASLPDDDDRVMKPRQYPNPFKTGDEAKKREERAKRFHDSPFKFGLDSATKEQEKMTVTDENLLELYKACGLFADDWGEVSVDKVGSQYRPDAILIRGINNMSTDEIFSYLYELGLIPEAMEWVNDACCIVIYSDKYEAAASLLKVTKPISVDHDVVEKKKNLDIEEKPIQDDEEQTSSNAGEEAFDFEALRVIPHNKIAVPMPLGHTWRYARPCPKAKGILMRFATVYDRKQEGAERHSEYYKKYGNPNNPKYRANEESPRKKRPFKRARYNPSPEFSSSEEEEKDGKKLNVWSKLSAEWQDEEGRASNSRSRSRPVAQVSLPSRRFHPRHRDGDDDEGLHVRTPRERRPGSDNFNGGMSRKRVWYDQDREGDLQVFTAGHLSDEEWTSRLKGPTMRMHADVEESRQKLQAIRKKSLTKSSISSRLGDRVVEAEFAAPSRRSVKDRLGSRQSYAQSHDLGDEEEEEGEIDEDLRNLLEGD